MVKNIQLLISLINPKIEKISFQETLRICLLEKNLPHSKGEVYFLISTLKALGIFEESKMSEYKINWAIYEKLKKEGKL